MNISVDVPLFNDKVNGMLNELAMANPIRHLVTVAWNEAYQLGCMDTVKKIQESLDKKPQLVKS